MLSTQLPSLDVLDSFSDLRLDGGNSRNTPVPRPSIRTFTRLARSSNNNSNLLIERKDIHDFSNPLLIQHDSLTEKPCPLPNTTSSRPCPTFTRLTKLHNNTLSLSLSLSPPPSAVPSLSSASSSCSSSSSSASSPSTSRFIFPTIDRKDWWQDLSLAETPTSEKEGRARPGSGASSNSGSGSGSGSAPFGLTSADKTLSPTHDGKASPILSQVSNRNSSAATEQSPRLLADREQESCSIGKIVQPTQQGYQRINPRTYFQARTRTPSPPPVITGFCSISNNPIKSSGEPSPQDFLGEADLPYPLPSTLHERQTRQRKRAEQLRQLKIREERETWENRRRVRRRGASFSAGMYSSSSIPHSPPSPSSLASGSLSRSLSTTLSSSWVNRQTLLGNHLKRSPSTPVKNSAIVNNGTSSSSTRKPRRCVGFDLRRTKVFEYDAEDDCSPCSEPSSPISGCSESQGYFNFSSERPLQLWGS